MTPKQKQAFDFIKQYIEENEGIAPSYDEIRNALGLASKSGVARLVYALEEMGLIKRHGQRARRLEIASTKDPIDFIRANGLEGKFLAWCAA